MLIDHNGKITPLGRLALVCGIAFLIGVVVGFVIPFFVR